MEIGRRYMYVETDNKTYTGDVVSITGKMLTIQNRSCEFYKKSCGIFSYELNLIKWTFPLADLIEGQQYSLTTENDKKHNGIFINISGIHDTVHLQTTNHGIVSLSLYSVKYIHKIL
jgi:hypothetical protein